MQKRKIELLASCKTHLIGKLTTLEATLADLKESLFSETKSTAGDKHETGRAMVQLEMEKTGHKVLEVQTDIQTIHKLLNTTQKDTQRVRLGTLVDTNLGTYLIAVSHGILKYEGTSYFVVSAISPVGKALLGANEGDELSFMGKQLVVKNIW
ncbi:hypothetical protein NBRC110019_24380 [Neptunitalea chrysea]|uniref:3-oxoacyl-ACP synthase n=1 Tax=Neptunitalea chrysea TaxID=1647581 RepID=A0A9W6B8C6_9FLAO|nr:3-oxoacyl-ACP synthase [Neptunitalea chrysea]GLB53397.1 hypothetical protein NBRC110019_24380 [Neptunitalea chrysea]